MKWKVKVFLKSRTTSSTTPEFIAPDLSEANLIQELKKATIEGVSTTHIGKKTIISGHSIEFFTYEPIEE